MNLMPAAPATDFRAQAQAETTADQPRHPRRAPDLAHGPPRRRRGNARPGHPGRERRAGDGRAQDGARRRSSKDPTLPFDQALIKVDPNLKYSELMQVIDVFSSLKVTKISFAELGPNEAGVMRFATGQPSAISIRRRLGPHRG